MNKNIRSIALMAALAFILVIGVVAQQKSADTAVDPVCGMTVVKANAKATFDYKGTTYYFCNPGCKDAFVKEPEKYLAKAKGEGAVAGEMGQMGHMGQMGGQAAGQMGMMKHEGMAGCPMMGGGTGQMGMMHGRMGMQGRGMMAPGMGVLFKLYGDKIEMAVEDTKDGAVLKVTSKDPEVVKAIQVHMAEHMAMMKKMKEAPAKAPAAAGAGKMSESASCADCPMKKK
jgi:YHS domain-containing protein